MKNFVLPAPQQLISSNELEHYHLTIMGDNRGSCVADMNDYAVMCISMVSCKKDAYLLIMHWSYISFALCHGYEIWMKFMFLLYLLTFYQLLILKNTLPFSHCCYSTNSPVFVWPHMFVSSQDSWLLNEKDTIHRRGSSAQKVLKNINSLQLIKVDMFISNTFILPLYFNTIE